MFLGSSIAGITTRIIQKMPWISIGRPDTGIAEVQGRNPINNSYADRNDISQNLKLKCCRAVYSVWVYKLPQNLIEGPNIYYYPTSQQ